MAHERNEVSSDRPAESGEPSARRVALGLVWLCVLAIGLRVYVAFATAVISPDSALLIDYARRLASEPLVVMNTYQQHPLYPALILACHSLLDGAVGDDGAGWIFAGRCAAVLGSLGAILAMYWLTAGMYDRRRGLIAAALIALLPDACQLGGDVLTDMPHLALYLLGLAALLHGLQGRRWLLWLAAGASGLAFLTRPEGGSVMVIAAGLVLLRGGWPWKRRVVLVVGIAAIFFVLAAPYQIAVGKLVPKKSVLDLFRFGAVLAAGTDCPTEPALMLGSQPALLATDLPVSIDVLRQWARAGRVVYPILALIGLAAARPKGSFGFRLLAVAFGLHVVVLHALSSSYGYLDRRHALILAVVSLPLAAAGIWWLAARKGAHERRGITRRAVMIVAVCALVTSPWMLRPRNVDEAHLVPAARWVATHTEPDALLIGDQRLHRVALYADRPFVEWWWWDHKVADLVRFLDEESVTAHPHCYIALDVRRVSGPDGNPKFFDHLAKRLGPRLELLHTEPGPPFVPPTEVRIYRYRR